MSLSPAPPVRALVKNSIRPSSESDGPQSPTALFTIVPRFTGSPHAADSDDRLATQISFPSDGDRLEQKYSESPSADSAGPCSFVAGRFTGAASGTGGDQS